MLGFDSLEFGLIFYLMAAIFTCRRAIWHLGGTNPDAEEIFFGIIGGLVWPFTGIMWGWDNHKDKIGKLLAAEPRKEKQKRLQAERKQAQEEAEATANKLLDESDPIEEALNLEVPKQLPNHISDHVIEKYQREMMEAMGLYEHSNGTTHSRPEYSYDQYLIDKRNKQLANDNAKRDAVANHPDKRMNGHYYASWSTRKSSLKDSTGKNLTWEEIERNYW